MLLSSRNTPDKDGGYGNTGSNQSALLLPKVRQIEAAKIEILLHSAQVAPVACNKRDHIHISLISDLELLEAWDHAAACYVGAIKSHPLYHAPAVLLISVRPDASDPLENSYLNAGCAAENVTLAATSLGLGSVLLAMPVRALRKEEALLDRFALPDNFQPVIAVAFGYEQADPIPPKSSFLRMAKFTRSFTRSRVKSSLSTKCSPR